MRPELGWIELSAEALRRMKQELDDTEAGVVDEIGVLAIHSGYADRFFPGTSVLQTRPRYLFFTCWSYLWLKDQGIIGDRFAAEKVRAEHWVTAQLLESYQPAKTGIIGGTIYPRDPAQPVDFIYWTALNRYGFYAGPRRSVLHARWTSLDVRGTPRACRDEEMVESEHAATFLAPPAPHWWQQKRPRHRLVFELERDEAVLLRDRLRTLDDCILSEMVARDPVAPRGADLWTDTVVRKAAASLGCTPQIERARDASSMGYLVRATYGALVEQMGNDERKRGQRSADYTESLEELLASDGGVVVAEAVNLSIAKLVEDLPTLRRSFVELLQHMADCLGSRKSAAALRTRLLDSETRRRFAQVEQERKGGRARLADTPAGAALRREFTPQTVRLYALDYRWPRARTLLADICAGLGR